MAPSAPARLLARCAAVTVLGAAPGVADPAPAFLVKDIDTSAGGFRVLTPAVDGAGVAFFNALLPTSGVNLWKSDGTPAGTGLVKDLVAGTEDSWAESAVYFAGKIFFAADGGPLIGRELWKTDGTSLVKDIVSGPGSGLPFESPFAILNGTLYFAADDGSTGYELWKSDGTAAGTVLVKDIVPGAGGASMGGFVSVNGTVLFAASTPAAGSELWRTDGTEAGTVLVEDIRPGSGSASPTRLTSVNDTLFFFANDGVTGFELWKSDGTAAGTVLVKDIVPGATGVSVKGTAASGDSLLFVANDGVTGFELWRSDGTSDGTVLVKDVFPGAPDGALTRPFSVGSAVVFAGNDGVSGDEPWASDGSAANTHMLADVGGPDGGSMGAHPYTDLYVEFVASGSLVFFEAITDATGRELFAVPVAALMDSDLDGLDFAAETTNGTDPFDADSDDDGLADGAEVNTHGTDPLVADTDGDDWQDGAEVLAGTDPLDAQDFPPGVPLAGPWALGALAALLLAGGFVALARARAAARAA